MIKRNTRTVCMVLAALLFMAASLPAHAGIVYVKADAPGGGDGTSWLTAYNDLQAALGTAVSGDAIWVAAGTYFPSVSERSVSFSLASGVEIYGGFAGTETSLSERDRAENVTILSGDINVAGVNTDNSYHVVTGSGTDFTAVLDGFTVTGGYANGSGMTGCGGGMYSLGGSPTIANVIFSNNYAYSNGAGMNNDTGSSPKISNCIFTENWTAWTYGGGAGIANSTANPTLINVTIEHNSAGPGYGGGMFSWNSVPKLVNTIVWNNSATRGTNSQIYNNTSIPEISFCDIQGCNGSGTGWVTSVGADGGGNIDANPIFVGGDLRLAAISPAVNSGNDAAPDLPATDLDGHPRIAGSSVDMGAYERQCPTGGVVYVDDDASGLNDGTSWADAFTELREALEWATCGGVTEIWVAEGTYKPTSGTDRSATFELVNGVTLYGGFTGMETSVTERDSLGGTTILSGDIGTAGYSEDNSYHVVTGSDVDSTAVLDGFTVTGGYADGGGSASTGGGIYLAGGNPIIANVILANNYANDSGGGMYNSNTNAIVINAVFSDNDAYYGGGGMAIYGSNTTVINSVFIGNTCAYRWNGGGGICCKSSAPTLINVTMVNNDAGTGYGGAMLGYKSNPKLINSIIWGNTAQSSYNPQIWNNTTTTEISFSLVGGCGGSGDEWDVTYGVDYGGNIDIDPMFLNESGGDLRLFPESPAIDAGAADSIPSGIANDLRGNPRIVNAAVDMGAYESQASCPPGSIIYVDADATGENAGSSWPDAFTKLQYALEWASVCPGVTQIWVAEGTYKPGTDTDATNRSGTFQLLRGVAIYGGFQGIETDLSERDWEANVTVLSGDIGAPGDSTDNCYHVVTASGADATAVLDGFTITEGNADASLTASAPLLTLIEGYNYEDMGRDKKPTLSGESITGSRIIMAWNDTHGGGITNIGGSPTLRNLLISGNYAADGGGMYNDNGSPTLINVLFRDNTGIWGGAVHSWDAGTPKLVNVLFKGNSADFGGGLYNNWSNPGLVNVTMFGNGAFRGGGMYNNFSDPVLVNTILWGDAAEDGGDEIYNASATAEISYSLIAGSGGSGGWDPSVGTDGGNNIDADPIFADGSAGDFSLLPGSPAIDAGNNDPIPAGVTTDLAGNPRITNGTVDMGSYEFLPALVSAFPSPIVFTDPPLNESTCDTIYFANNGGAACMIAGIYGCSEAPFSIDSTMTAHTIEPGGVTGIAVCVFPIAAEPYTAELVVVSDAANSPTTIQISVEAVTDAGSQQGTSLPFRIVSISPNPFNPSTTVHFTLPSAMPVTAMIWSVTGARVRVLANEKQFGPGDNRLIWDGRTDRGLPVSSGVYFIRIEIRPGAKTVAQTRKMILLR